MRGWYTATELADLELPSLPCTRQKMNERARREDWANRLGPDGQPLARERQGRGGGWEYHIQALPEVARLKLAQMSVAVVSDYNPEAEHGLAQAAGLDAKRRVRAEARAAVVTACKLYLRDAGLGVERGLRAFVEAYNGGQLSVDDWVRRAIPSVSRGSLRNWAKHLRDGGLARLAGNYGNRAQSGKIHSNPEMVTLIEGMLHAYPHCSAAHVMDAIRARFAGVGGGEALPSYRSVQRYLSDYRRRNQQVLTAVANPDLWRSRYQAAGGSADEHVVRLNQEWELDSTVADLMLSDGRRHAVIAAIDIYSRRLKLRVDRTSRAAGIASVVRAAILDWGVPETVKTDNGADYTSRHITSVFGALGIEQRLCPPFSPEKKPFVERALKTFLHDLVELLPGFVGHNVAERQAIEARRSFAQRLMKRGRDGERAVVEAAHLSPEDLQAFCDRWCEDRYHHKPHGGLDDETPFARAAAWDQPVRRIEDERALDVLLSEPAGDGWRSVTKKGIRIAGHWYDEAALGGLEGQRVRVLHDDAEAAYIYVFDETGAFVCKAFSPELTGRSPREVAQSRRRKQRQTVAADKKRLSAAARRSNASDIPSEIMAEAGRQAATITAFPGRAEQHTTHALTQAGHAARAGRMPEASPRTAAEERQHAAIVADLSGHRAERAWQPPGDALDRTVLRLEVEADFAAGRPVQPEVERWVKWFASTETGQREMRSFREFAEARLAVKSETA